MDRQPAAKRKRVSRSDRIELQFLEGVRARSPSDTMVLRALGDLYTRCDRLEEGLAVDRQLIESCPHDANVWYNYACSLARLDQKEAALEALGHAVDLGYRDGAWMQCDQDLQSLHDDDRFRRLLDGLDLTLPF